MTMTILKKRTWGLFVFICLLLVPFSVHAQQEQPKEVKETYYIGKVVEVSSVVEEDPYLRNEVIQTVTVLINEGSGWEVEAFYSKDQAASHDDLRIGERVIVVKTNAFVDEVQYIITDRYRLPSVAILFLCFFLCAVVFAKKKGFTSILGLGVSLVILLAYTIPQIVGGAPPFLVACVSAFLIAIFSILTAHGFSKQTGVAVVSTLIALTLSLGVSQIFILAAKLTGLGTEDAYLLSATGMTDINLRGLLLAGIIIGVLGVLDDVTTAQTATVKQLAAAGVKGFAELYRRASHVGTEHIVSLVNTLALAYVGASLPLLMMFSLNEGRVPFWTILNSQIITEEIVRTLVGSVVLVLAVPISTMCAAWFYGKFPASAHEGEVGHSHVH